MSEKEPGLKIVSIGGGTGLSALLSGLKNHVGHDSASGSIETLTAVVTVTDDGGSSGRLRQEFQMLPPGDIRNCIVALAEDQRLLTRLLQHRFESQGDLGGHSFGNLFLTALTAVTGDFLEAIKVTSEVLAIKGRIFPSTIEDIALIAELEDGEIITGESNIVQARKRIRGLKLSRADCGPVAETLDAIRDADIITIGPGSLYTSIIPNLLVRGIAESISGSDALVLYISNIMTQPGETEGFSLEDHLMVLLGYSPGLRIDYVVVNSTPISDTVRDKYLADGAVQIAHTARARNAIDLVGPVESRPESLLDRYRIATGDLLDDSGDVVRHSSDKLSRMLLDIHNVEREARRRFIRRG